MNDYLPNRYLLFVRWLAVAGVVDWLLTRTVTRVAIFIPMPPALAAAFRLLDSAGQVVMALVGLLAFGVLVLIAWHEWRQRRGRGVAAGLIGLAGLSILFLFVPPPGWLALAGHACYLAVISLLIARAMPLQAESTRLNWAAWGALLLPALALVAGRLHHALPALYTTLQWPGPAPFSTLLFNLGELLIVLSAFALWWAYGREARWWAWLVAAVPALAYAALYLANTHMTGILTIWSTGMTLYLPWPLYAVAIWLAAATLLAPRVWTQGTGWAILLLAAGGYAPQLSAQAFLGLIALYLLAGGVGQSAAKNRSAARPNLPFVTPAQHQPSSIS